MKILMPVDGSGNAGRVAQHVVKTALLLKAPLEIHLLNVQHPLPGTIRGVAEQARQYHNDEGLAALAGARKILDDAGVSYTHHIRVGEAAPVVSQLVNEFQCDQVVMGTRGMGSVANMVLGSTAAKVLHSVQVPVVLVK